MVERWVFADGDTVQAPLARKPAMMSLERVQKERPFVLSRGRCS
jgi:hypothetical protein